ncbi:hypothetical protein L7F22_064604 [Adiantum nelumboides]|nr:hypothetical protein [Adiantum nelumboides]
MDMSKVYAIVHWSHPTNLEELQIFLGLAGFYCNFIRDYAKIFVPMIDRLKAQVEDKEEGKDDDDDDDEDDDNEEDDDNDDDEKWSEAKQWAKAPYEVDELSTHEKAHIFEDILAQIPAHIFIAKFKDAENDSIKMTIMLREIWTLHRKLKVVNAVRAIHLEQFFRLLPWGTDYMRAHELMSSIQYNGQALLTDKDGSKARVLITRDIINEALHFHSRQYDLLAKTKYLDNEKAFIKAKGNKYKYSDMIYSELELPLRLISQHFRVQKPPRYTEPLLHIAMVMALAVAKNRTIRCDYGKFILENLVEANMKGSPKNKLYMSLGPMLARIAYQALGTIEDLPVANFQASLIQHVRFVACPVKTTTTATSSRTTRSSKKSSSDDEKTDTDKEADSKGSDEEDSQKGAEAKGPSEFNEKRKKKLANDRVAKAAATKQTIPRTIKQARLERIERAKGLQAKKQRIEAKQRAQEVDLTSQETQDPKEKEVVDLTGHIAHLKKIQRDKKLEEQRAAALAREKIKEGLKRSAEQAVLEPQEGEPKKQHQEVDEEDLENIQADPTPPSPKCAPPASPHSPDSPIPPVSPSSPKPPPSPKSPSAPKSHQQQPSAEEISAPPKTQVPEEIEVQKESSKIQPKDNKTLPDALEHQEQDQGPRGMLEPHPPGPPQEKVQIHLPTREILEPRTQSPSSTRSVPVLTLIIQIDPTHDVKVKELEQQLAQAKAELQAQKNVNETLIKEKESVGSQAQPPQISIVETHLHVQLPHMPEMPDLRDTS